MKELTTWDAIKITNTGFRFSYYGTEYSGYIHGVIDIGYINPRNTIIRNNSKSPKNISDDQVIKAVLDLHK